MVYTATNGVEIHECVQFAPGEMMCSLIAYEQGDIVRVVTIRDFDLKFQPNIIAILSPIKLYND